MNETEKCCPPFDPKPWDGITHEWKDKPFITDSIPQFMHVPLPGTMARMMKRITKKAEELGIATDEKNFLLLAHDPSPWKSVFYLAVTKDHPQANVTKLSGKYLSRVFDGPYNMIPTYIRETEISVKAENYSALKYYFYYTTCPKCAKKYGHNYIVVLAEVMR
jgi:hypothetical protein